MNKEAIRKTAVCYWSDEDDCYVIESPLFSSIAGAGETTAEAFQTFENLLSDAYEAYLEGRVPQERRGRPSKSGLALNTDVKPETKDVIVRLAKEFGCSQGEVIDYLALYYDKKSSEEYQAHKDQGRLEVSEKLSTYMHQLEDLVQKMKTERKRKAP